MHLSGAERAQDIRLVTVDPNGRVIDRGVHQWQPYPPENAVGIADRKACR